MIAAFDVDYRESCAIAAGVWFRGWQASVAESEAVAMIADVAEYRPGEFYRRELPCLLEILKRGPLPDFIAVDGYVTLGEGRPGLGLHLFDELNGSIPVVGIAKTRFHSATEAIAVCRGDSRAPLFVTAVGVSSNDAADWVRTMYGEYRLPTFLKRVDRLARDTVPLAKST